MKEANKELKHEEKPKIVCVVDEPTQHGIEKGYYPDLTKNKHFVFLNQNEENKISDVKYKGGFELGKTYVYCPADCIYIPLSHDDLSEIYSQKRINACYTALRMMGAKNIKYKLSTLNKKHLSWKVEGGINSPLYTGEVEVSEEKKKKLENVISKERIKEKYTATIDDIQRYLEVSGLEEDDDIKVLFNELKEERELTGSYNIKFKTISSHEEIFKTAAKIGKSKVFTADAKFNMEVNTLYEIEYELNVIF